MSKRKRGGLSDKDPIKIIRRLKAQNDKAQQGNKPDWEDKFVYGLSDW